MPLPTMQEMDEVRAWLSWLDDKLWTVREEAFGSQRRKFATRRRKLTEDEWKRVKKIAGAFVIEPVNCSMGFNFGIFIHDAPTYIGMPPERLILIEGGHLPEGMDDSFDGSWKEMSPLSHNPANEARLKLFGLPPLQTKGHYDY